MLADLLLVIEQMPSTLQTPALACPAGLIVGLHYLGKRKQPNPVIYYDVSRQDRLAAEAASTAGFSHVMVCLGLGISLISFLFLVWPEAASSYAANGLQFLRQVTNLV